MENKWTEKEIEFYVPGAAATAGSKTAGMTMDGRRFYRPASKFTKPWMDTVKFFAGQCCPKMIPWRCPVSLSVHFKFIRPKGHYGTGRNALLLKKSAPREHVKKPDLSKLVRCVEDALTGIVWVDDSQVTIINTSKRYATDDYPAGAYITIRKIEHEPKEADP